MVRRFCAVCFLLLCLLIACAEDQDISPTPVSPPPTSTPTPSDTPLPDTIVPSPEPELRYPVKLPNGIPDIPAYDSGEIGRRYYKDTMLALVAKPDYGEIYPFIGAYTLSDWGGVNYLYGFCDTKGRIVCDPVYARVERLTDNGQMLYFMVKYKPVPKDGYVDSEPTYVLAAADGRWVQAYENALWPREKTYFGWEGGLSSPYNTQYITVYDGKGWGAVDYGGQSVHTCKEIFPVEFCEGLAVVYNADQVTYRYIDTAGRTVLGPYTLPEKTDSLWHFTSPNLHFSDGLARYYENGLWGYINKQGEIVIAPQFRDSSAFFEGWAYVNSMYYEEGLFESGTIDTLGNRIEQPNAIWLTYDYGWSLAASGDAQIVSNGTDVLTFASTDNITPIARDRLFVIEYKEDGYEWHVVDSGGNAVSPIRNGYAYVNEGYIWHHASDVESIGLYDANGREIVSPLFLCIKVYGDYFCVANRDYGGLMDKNGNWIVKQSLLEYKDD